LIWYQLSEGAKHLREQLSSGKGEFEARNDSQVYLLREVPISFIERLVIVRFLENIEEGDYEENAKAGIEDLFFSAWPSSFSFEGQR